MYTYPVRTQQIARKTYTEMCILGIPEDWGLEEQARRGVGFSFTSHIPILNVYCKGNVS